MIENLSESFGLKCRESENLMDFKKCEDGSMLAYNIIVGSEEKVMNDLSGKYLYVYPNCREFIAHKLVYRVLITCEADLQPSRPFCLYF